ncbi:MAG: DUF1559 domain-containing protein [Planctomycetaceae bacterium]
MHAFPPPIWTMQHWSLWSITCIVVFGIIGPLIALRKSSPRKGVVVAWTLYLSILWYIASSFRNTPESTFSPYRYIVVLPLAATALGIAALYRIMNQPRGYAAIWNGITLAVLLGIVAGVFLLVSDSYSRPASRRTHCKYNLKQLALAMHNYLDVAGRFPPAVQGTPPISWRVRLLPWIEQSRLLESYDQSKAWDSEENRPLLSTEVRQYACPSRPSSFNEQGHFLTSYVAPTGSETMFYSEQGTATEEFQDGISNTMMLVEACGSSIVWSEPRDIDIATTPIGINLPGREFGESDSLMSSWHSGGSQAALADGSVRFFSASTDPMILKAMVTRNGGELVDDTAF